EEAAAVGSLIGCRPARRSIARVALGGCHPQRPLAATFGKGHDPADPPGAAVFGADALHPPRGRTRARKHSLVGSPDTVQIGPGEFPALQSDRVQPHQIGFRTEGETERNDVPRDSAHAAEHGALADPAELVYGRVATDEDMIGNGDMATQ